MAYDIYGNNLRKGYCEVHPDVHQEYPCDLCYASDNIILAQNNYKEDHRKEWEDALRVYEDESRGVIGEHFSATMNLRYAQRQTLSSSNNTTTLEGWLQQMWQGSNGTQEWRWVEEIEE